MAHFAKLDDNNLVLEVVVVNNEVIHNLPFPESEPIGVAFCKSLFGADSKWAQTSYNGSFRYRYAGVGNTFYVDATPSGAFIEPQPYPSWSLDPSNYAWVAPVPYPNDGQDYYWDEATLSWVLVPAPDQNQPVAEGVQTL